MLLGLERGAPHQTEHAGGEGGHGAALVSGQRPVELLLKNT